MENSSNIVAEMRTPGGELSIALRDFKRFPDDSSVLFKLDCRSSYFDIHDFDFYADTASFRTFLPALKKAYKEVEGEAIIRQTHEDSLIKIKVSKSGRIFVLCEAFCHNEYSEQAKIGFQLDQTFLPKFISDLSGVYDALRL